jgi:proline iminopeptidase
LILVAPAGVLTPPDKDRNLFDLTRAQLSGENQRKFDDLLEEYFDFGNIFSKSDGDLVDLHHRMGQYLLSAMGYDESELALGPRSGGWAVFAMYFSAGRAQDFRPALQEVKAPTLIIHGEDDTMSLPGAHTYEPIRGSHFVLIGREEPERRAGHFIFDDCPTRFGQVVDEFLLE